MMTEDQVYAFLDQTFRTVFKRDDIKLIPTLSAADVEGWDSFTQIAIVVSTEEQFDIEFRGKEMESLKNVGDFVALVLRKTAGVV